MDFCISYSTKNAWFCWWILSKLISAKLRYVKNCNSLPKEKSLQNSQKWPITMSVLKKSSFGHADCTISKLLKSPSICSWILISFKRRYMVLPQKKKNNVNSRIVFHELSFLPCAVIRQWLGRYKWLKLVKMEINYFFIFIDLSKKYITNQLCG